MIFPIISKVNNRSSDEFLELRYLKLALIGFFNKNEKTNFLADIKIKQILKEFIKNIKLVNKVIENKYRFLSLNDKKAYNLKYKQFSNEMNNLSLNINYSKTGFQLFLVNVINKTSSNKLNIQDITSSFKFNDIYKRLNVFFSGKEQINDFLIIIKEKLRNFTASNIKKTIYSVQVFDKMIKLITKIVLSNSKFFFLNNIKYNYTLLKFCDKTMKLINSILLFCLLCDINIPYYCFHSDLSIAGNCRMCLVQLDTSLKPIASCAVSISINSTIYTNTKIIQKAREGVLEFLLINHPLDCPICDQGGECDLQEQFITYGNDRGRFSKKMI